MAKILLADLPAVVQGRLGVLELDAWVPAPGQVTYGF